MPCQDFGVLEESLLGQSEEYGQFKALNTYCKSPFWKLCHLIMMHQQYPSHYPLVNMKYYSFAKIPLSIEWIKTRTSFLFLFTFFCSFMRWSVFTYLITICIFQNCFLCPLLSDVLSDTPEISYVNYLSFYMIYLLIFSILLCAIWFCFYFYMQFFPEWKSLFDFFCLIYFT